MAQQILFQKNLVDIVRGLRNNKKSEKDYISKCLADIKDELRSKEHSVKVMAVVKMAYFNMLGYSVEYGAFNVIEVMSDTNYTNKRIGYAAAAAGFHHDTSVLPLVTNLLKRDILSSQQYEAGLGLYCLSCICTPDLAKDLVSDVASLLNSQRAYVRKKTVLCLYKLIIQYPEALRPIFPRLKDKLEDGNEKSDNDPSVRGAVVNVLCELARRNPANYLGLAVTFFSLLSTVHNNWTLIKIVKLFGVWAPLEPRLGKKLVEPLTNLINTTPAKSVQYECVYTVANGMCKQSSITKLAVDKMKQFAQDYDQNLKYLGLEAMCLLMKENPKVLADQRDIVLSCVEDPDVTIRMKALQLMRGMSTKKTLQPTVSKLFEHIIRNPPEDSWSNAVIRCIISTVSDNDYINCTDFEWYLKVLVDLVDTQITNFEHGALIANEFQVIVTRVEGVRSYAIDCLCSVLLKPQLLACDVERSTQWLVCSSRPRSSWRVPTVHHQQPSWIRASACFRRSCR
jgi:AP-3 complex subunit delta